MKERLRNMVTPAFEKEEIRLRLMDLDRRNIDSSEIAKKSKWYGKRLKIIREYYGITTSELVMLMDFIYEVHSAKSIISKWENNYKPHQNEISKLAFIFEVPEEFFTSDIINITINEQLKIEMK